MPKVAGGMRYKKKYDSNDVNKAIDAVLIDNMPKKTASKLFNVPRATLQFRLKLLNKNCLKKNIRHGPPTVLNETEEATLVDWISVCCKKGFPRRKEDIQAAVKEFLENTERQNPFKDNYPGDGWYKLFLKRHPELSVRTSEGVTAASSVVAELDIKKWFQKIEDYLKGEGLEHVLEDPRRIFNGDETNFQLCPKNEKVVAPRGEKNIYEIDCGTAKTSITVMFTFSADGDVTPPMIIYPYKRLPKEISKTVPKSWGIGLSDNGWMKAEVFYEYIGNVLYPFLIENNVQFPIILFVDGHKTHLTFKLSELCKKLNIVLISLYPNSTRILQPADVSAFKPLKTGWKKGVLEWRRNNPAVALTKDKFAPILEIVLQKCLSKDTIRNGFKACGLYPWNSNSINYEKCLGRKLHETENLIESAITYKEFYQIVGEKRIKLFEERRNQNESEEFKTLYRLWKQFLNKASSDNVDLNISCGSAGNDNSINTPLICNEIQNEIESNENNLLIDGIPYDITEMPIILTEEIIENRDFVNDVPVMTNEVFENKNIANDVPAILPEEIIKDNDIINDVPETLTEEVMRMKNPLSDTANSSLNDYLMWPITPERKGTRNSNKLPFVLTSAHWQQIQKQKIDEKKKQDIEKEERKKLKLEKKQVKEKINILKSNSKFKKTKSCKKTVVRQNKNKEVNLNIEIPENSDCTVPNIENVIINDATISLRDDTTLSKKSVVQSNNEKEEGKQNVEINGKIGALIPAAKNEENNKASVSLKDFATDSTCDNRCKNDIPELPLYEINKPLSGKNINVISCQKVHYDLEKVLRTESVKKNLFSNKEFIVPSHLDLKKGMCHSCLFNISARKPGVQCSRCIRQFHFDCMKDKEKWICGKH